MMNQVRFNRVDKGKFYIVKTDPNGEQVWTKTFGGGGVDIANSVIETSDGNYLIAGYVQNKGAGAGDMWLVKIDPAGNLLWDKTLGKSGPDQAKKLIQTTDNNYAILGTISQGITLLKIDTIGNIIWETVLGNTVNSRAMDLVQTSDGGFAVTGWTEKNTIGKKDVWLTKTDANGKALWFKTIGGKKDDEGLALVQTFDGGLAIGGYTKSWGKGKKDAWLIKTDIEGNMLWWKNFGGRGHEVAYDLIQTLDGGFAIAGDLQNRKLNYDYQTYSADYWLIKTDSNGNRIWDKNFGGSSPDIPASLIQTDDHALAMVGRTGNKGSDSYDFFLVKTTPPPLEESIKLSVTKKLLTYKKQKQIELDTWFAAQKPNLEKGKIRKDKRL